MKTRKTLNCPATGCTNAECTGDYGMLSKSLCLEGILHMKIIRSPLSFLFLMYEKGQAPYKLRARINTAPPTSHSKPLTCSSPSTTNTLLSSPCLSCTRFLRPSSTAASTQDPQVSQLHPECEEASGLMGVRINSRSYLQAHSFRLPAPLPQFPSFFRGSPSAEKQGLLMPSLLGFPLQHTAGTEKFNSMFEI